MDLIKRLSAMLADSHRRLLIRRAQREVDRKVEEFMASIVNLEQAVTEVETASASAISAINTLKAQVAQGPSQANIDALETRLIAVKDALVAALPTP
jgi:hypothetical protein